MGVPLHTINILDSSTPRAELDRLNMGFLFGVSTPAAGTSLTLPGTITPGTAFTSLPTITLTAGTGSGGSVIATSLKVVSATVVAGGTSGFANADTITLSNGVVLAVATNASGVVSTVTVTTAGAFLGPAPNLPLSANPVVQTATSGSGVGTTSFTLVYGLGTAQVVNSGSYSVVPTGSTVTGGGGSGASLGAPTLGGAGNSVAVAVTIALPAQTFIMASPNVVGDVYIVNKSISGFSVVLAPALAATVLTAASVDLFIVS